MVKHNLIKYQQVLGLNFGGMLPQIIRLQAPMQAENKNSDLSAGEDSIDLLIEPQKAGLLRLTDFDCKYKQDLSNLSLYVELDPKTLLSLIKGTQKPAVYENNNKLLKNCFFYKKIRTPSGINGSFYITHEAYQGMCFFVYFNQNTQISTKYVRICLHFFSNDKWGSQWVSQPGQDEQTTKFSISSSEIEKYLAEKFLFEMHFQKNVTPSQDHIGLANSGNVCYMNSIIQVLFHFKPFRKLVLEAQTKGPQRGILVKLQEIFVQMMTEKKTVNADSLLETFGQFSQIPRQQQDTHQFLIALLDQIETICPEAKHFWSGRQIETIFSKDAERPYKSEQQQDFNEIPLRMKSATGFHYTRIEESIRELIMEQSLPDSIDVEGHGLITAFKIRKFAQIPPLLFFNIYRYNFDKHRRQSSKINLYMNYPSSIDLGFLIGTPGGLNYSLFSVVVHQGKTPNQGHYFSFVNVSESPDEPKWFQFNDSRVSQASVREVLEKYTGREKTAFFLDKKYGKWIERKESSQETAYLLIYLRTDLFAEYQTTETRIPVFHLERLQRKLTKEEAAILMTVKVFALKQEDNFDPFSSQLELLEFKLRKDSNLEEQLKKKIDFLGCSVGTIWKVNSRTKKIKRVRWNMPVERHINTSRGYRQPDYILVVPSDVQYSQDDDLGLVRIRELSEEEEISKVTVLNKLQIRSLLETAGNRQTQLIIDSNQADMFFEGWNDYLQIVKE